MSRIPRTPRAAVVAAAAVLVALGIGALWLRGGDGRESLGFARFEQELAEGGVRTAEIRDRDARIVGELSDGTEYETTFVREYGDELVDHLRDADVEVTVDQQEESVWSRLLVNLLPLALFLGVIVFFLHSMQSGGRGVMQFGKARAKTISRDRPTATFADVAGVDEAVEELKEIEEFLESPARFKALGAEIPKGVLLYGPPGTGKTLLARAVAGEAGVPFFSISGSDFVEMFVGVGASRVRDLFEQAKRSAPAIVFVDEIDAVGRHRGAGLGGGHDEREQTLNQLLVEMDGFDVGTGVILIAATNRPDILDPALLRPGRFDRQIVVDRPDLVGRRAILAVHVDGKRLAPDVDLDVVARRTPGFTGADLANLVNEAALLAARRGAGAVARADLEGAIDRVIGGPERKTRVMSEREKRQIAFHEGGHALVGHVLADTDPIHKVSIVSRGRALGWTLALPAEDRYLHTRAALRDQLAMLLGGRTAEELVYGDPTTGAADDIEKATHIARAMVTEYGMSDRLGPQQLIPHSSEVFLGRDVAHQRDHSDAVAAVIDEEVRVLLDSAHQEAGEILRTHRPTLDALAGALCERETLDEAELGELFSDLPAWVRSVDGHLAAVVPGPRGGGNGHRRRAARPVRGRGG